MRPYRKLLWLPILMLFLAGCSPLVTQAQESISASPLLISGAQAAGQTFTAHQAGLQGLEVYLLPSQPGSGQVTLRLYAPQVGKSFSNQLLAQASIPLASISQAGWYRFDFDSHPDSNQRDYAFVLQVMGDGQVAIGSAPGNAYLEGSAYLGDQPADNAQLAFRTVYRARWMVFGLLSEGLSWLGLLAFTLLAFVLPGWALLSGLWPGWGAHTWEEKLGLSIGLSLAIYPLLLLWTDLVGLHLGIVYAIVPFAAALVFLVWKNRNPLWQCIRRPFLHKPGAPRRAWGSHLPFASAFIFVSGLTFFVRFYAVRTLSMPLWGDSYHHTLIAQLIVDHNGLFQSWQPYTPLQTLTYHFGFHSAVAVFHWLTNLDVAQATLWFGQILNGLAILALYPLVVRVSGGRRWGGIGAMLIAGLLSPLPMFYTNWGRYTQLAGQAILPAAVCLGWGILEATQAQGSQAAGKQSRLLSGWLADWRSLIPAGLAMAGLALTHYRILIFAALFFLAYLAFNLRRTNWKPLLVRLLALTLFSGILALPWLLRSYGSSIMKMLTNSIGTPAAAVSSGAVDSNMVPALDAYFPILLWLVFILAFAWSLWRRSRSAALFSVWWFLCLLATNPAWIGLPGTGVITNFTLLLAVYIPAGVLIGLAAADLADVRLALPPIWRVLAALVLVAGLGLWGAQQRIKDVSAGPYALAVQPDVRAAAWIRANTPKDAGFLVNDFFAYDGAAIVGSDGGWWLPYLAQRSINVPPLTYLAEQGPQPDFIPWINALASQIDAKGVSDPAVLAELKARGLNYIYIGQQQGQVNYNGPQALDPLKLSQDAHFQTVYHQDRVWIFKLLP